MRSVGLNAHWLLPVPSYKYYIYLFKIICGTRNASHIFKLIGLAAPRHSRTSSPTTCTTTHAIRAINFWSSAGNIVCRIRIVIATNNNNINYCLSSCSFCHVVDAPVDVDAVAGNSARYAYETCIYNSARYKCYKHSAEFARETAKMLSDEKHFSNCRHVEEACSHAGRIFGLWSSLLPLAVTMLLRCMRTEARP